MKSPYAVFVRLIARLVNGAYPAQFSSRIHTQSRIVLGGTTAINVLVAVFVSNPIYMREITTAQTPLDYTLSAFIIISFLAIISVGSNRYLSIEQHAMETSFKQIANQDRSMDAVEDVNYLYDYLKVFFTLTVITLIPSFIQLFTPSNPIVQDAVIILHTPSLYYLIITLGIGTPLLGRWGRGLVNNDNQDTTDSTPNKN